MIGCRHKTTELEVCIDQQQAINALEVSQLLVACMRSEAVLMHEVWTRKDEPAE